MYNKILAAIKKKEQKEKGIKSMETFTVKIPENKVKVNKVKILSGGIRKLPRDNEELDSEVND